MTDQPTLPVSDLHLEGLFVSRVVISIARPLAYAALDMDPAGLIHTSYAIYTHLVETVLDRHTVHFLDHDVDIDRLIKSVWDDARYETKTEGDA